MKTENEETKGVKRVLRVALRPETEKILKNWRAQLQLLFPTFDPSTADLLSWAVERSSALSKKEIHEIKTRFFDDVTELESLLLRLRKATKEGDEKAVSELLSTITIRRKSNESQSAQASEM